MINMAATTTPAMASDAISTAIAPRLDWREMSSSDHFVRFYESDASLVASVSGFIGPVWHLPMAAS